MNRKQTEIVEAAINYAIRDAKRALPATDEQIIDWIAEHRPLPRKVDKLIQDDARRRLDIYIRRKIRERARVLGVELGG
jgi:hypothetical protein